MESLSFLPFVNSSSDCGGSCQFIFVEISKLAKVVVYLHESPLGNTLKVRPPNRGLQQHLKSTTCLYRGDIK